MKQILLLTLFAILQLSYANQLLLHLKFIDNGRDWLDNNSPPDELNYAPTPKMNFGFPYVYGNNIPELNFKNQHNYLCDAICDGRTCT